MSFKDILTEARRLEILRLLLQDADESVNDRVMRTALADRGHGVHRDVVRADYRHLESLGVVGVEDVGEGLLVARLTDHGAQVAEGRASVPGVARHRP